MDSALGQLVGGCRQGQADNVRASYRCLHRTMATAALNPHSAVPATTTRAEDAWLISLVSLAHGLSHFAQLLLPPLFPWLKDAFGTSYAELGALLTVFFIVSCAVQALSGFWVDRFGTRPVLFAGLALVGLAALGFASSTSYTQLVLCAVVAGTGNGVFHPVDYTLLNRRVAPARLGHAYSAHGISGSLGWALAPLVLVPITLASSWRVALLVAAGMAFGVLALLLVNRARLQVLALPAPKAVAGEPAAAPESMLGFMRLPVVWVCFSFFFFYAGALSVVQTFAPQAAGHLHAVPAQWAAMCLTVYMVCSACGMVLGGFVAKDVNRSARIVAVAFSLAALMAIGVAYAQLPPWGVPLAFGAMGFVGGISGPSRDLIVRRAAPDHASGRFYGVVYGGLDVGQAVIPLIVGSLMDRANYSSVWLALAVLQGVLIVNAFNVVRSRRPEARLGSG